MEQQGASQEKGGNVNGQHPAGEVGKPRGEQKPQPQADQQDSRQFADHSADDPGTGPAECLAHRQIPTPGDYPEIRRCHTVHHGKQVDPERQGKPAVLYGLQDRGLLTG